MTLPAMDQANVQWKACPGCAAQMPPTASFCPGCGRSMQIQVRTRQSVGALRENLAGALAYVTLVPAIAFLLMDPYRRNSFVRFHSVQCLLCWLAGAVLAVGLRVISLVLLFVPVVGPMLALILSVVLCLAVLFTWLVLLVKAFQGEKFVLPLIGPLAEQYSHGA